MIEFGYMINKTTACAYSRYQCGRGNLILNIADRIIQNIFFRQFPWRSQWSRSSLKTFDCHCAFLFYSHKFTWKKGFLIINKINFFYKEFFRRWFVIWLSSVKGFGWISFKFIKRFKIWLCLITAFRWLLLTWRLSWCKA